MKILRKMKKGFTIVELVIVIAVIAVLTAILVPTFINLGQKANKANDNSMVTNLNKALRMAEADNEIYEGHKLSDENFTMHDAVLDLRAYGYELAQLVTKSEEKLVYSLKENKFYLSADSEIGQKYASAADKAQYLWTIQNSVSGSEIYSVYAGPHWSQPNITNLHVGFDAGFAKGIESVDYSSNVASPRTLVVRTNSVGTSVSIDGYVDSTDNTQGDILKHFGSVGELKIIKCAVGSYHENGKAAFAEINTGRIVLEKGSEIKRIHINANEDADGFDDIIISDNGADALPVAITRDEVTVTSETLVVTVESNGTSENVYVYASGSQGSTEKTDTQNTDVDSALGQLVLDDGFDTKVLSEEVKERTKEETINDARVEEYSSSEAKSIPENAVAYNLNSDEYYCSDTEDYATGMAALRGALDNAASKDTIVLLNDVTITQGASIRFPVSKSVTINGNNHTVNISGRGFGVGVNATSKIDVTFKNITIINNNSEGRGIDTRGNLSSLTLDNVAIKTPAQTTQPLTIGGNQSDIVPVMIKNSTIETTEEGKWGYAITTFNPVDMTIIHSKLSGWACLNIKGPNSSAGSSGSTFNMSDTHFVSKNVYAGDTNAFSIVKMEDHDITVNFTLLACTFDIIGQNNSQGIVSFQDMTFSPVGGCVLTLGEGTVVNFSGSTYFADCIGSTSMLVIIGGSYNADPSAFVPEGYTVTEQDGIWTVHKQ